MIMPSVLDTEILDQETPHSPLELTNAVHTIQDQDIKLESEGVSPEIGEMKLSTPAASGARIEEREARTRGKPITCKICKHQFKFNKPELKQEWYDTKMCCPSCGEQYCCLPETERVLRKIEDEYYEKGKNKRYLDKMYLVLVSYCKSLLLKSYPNMIGSAADLEYHSHQVVTIFMEKYCIYDNFKVDVSFAGALISRIRQSLWGKPEHKVAPISLDVTDDENRNIFQIADQKYSLDAIENKQSSLHTRDYILRIIFEIDNYCNTKQENFIRLLLIRNFLRKGEKITDKYFYLYGRNGKEMFLRTLEIMKKELMVMATN